MQTALLASLVTSMRLDDAAFKAGMAQVRADAKKTGQDVDASARQMEDSYHRAERVVVSAMDRIAASAVELGQKVRKAGLALTAGLTVPMGLIAKSSKDTASDFQAAMNGVRAAMLQATPDQIKALSAAAMEMGPEFRRSATEAANAIEMLAKNGMDAEAILGGGLRNSLILAAVGQADLSQAADLTTDIMQQFHKSAADLPRIVNQVSGALDVSKMGFDDYALAIAQAGGVAGGLGVDFTDMNTALAASASYFDSGSDAGTSFKTFITSLSGNSEDAKKAIKAMGLEFYDAQKRMKPMADIAEELRDRLGNLNEQEKSDVLRKIFGNDAMRTAIGLMDQGAEGIRKVQASIDGVTANDKMAVLLQGDADASARLATALDKLRIMIGNVILPYVTAFKNALASLVETFASAPPWMFKVAAGMGLVAAAIGPLLLSLPLLAKGGVALLALRMASLTSVAGKLAIGFAALVNPIGLVARGLVALAVRVGLVARAGALAAALGSWATGIGLVVTAIMILLPLLNKLPPVSEAVRKGQEAVNAAQKRGQDIANKLAISQGKARDEAIKLAKAQRDQARAAIVSARANLQAARAAAMQQIQQAQDSTSVSKNGIFGAATNIFAQAVSGNKAGGAARDYAELSKQMAEWTDLYDKLDAQIKDVANGPTGPTDLPDMSDPKKKKKGPKDTSAQDAARYQDELARLRAEQLSTLADLNGSIEAHYDAENASIEADRQAYMRSLALDDSLTEAKRKELAAAYDKVVYNRKTINEQERYRALADRAYDIQRDENQAAQDLLRNQIDLADSAEERRAGELRLLALQKRDEEAYYRKVLATEDASSAARAEADRMLSGGGLDAKYKGLEATTTRNTEGPQEAYLRSLNMSSAAIGEAMQNVGVSAMQSFNDELARSVTGFIKLKGVAGSFVNSMLNGILQIGIQQNIIKPLAGLIFGGEAGGGLFGSIGRMFGAATPRANGGPMVPGRTYEVGEHGREWVTVGGMATATPDRRAGQTGRREGGVMEIRLRDDMLEGRIISGAARVTQAGIAEKEKSDSYRAGRGFRG